MTSRTFVRVRTTVQSVHPTSGWCRSFTTSQAYKIFAGIAQSRITLPWIDAFQNKDKQQVTSSSRSVEPKKMSESYHRVVRFVSILVSLPGTSIDGVVRCYL